MPNAILSLLSARRALSSGDVLTAENLEGLLERFDLLLAAGDPVLVAHARIHARGLQLFIIRKSGIQLFLGAIEVGLLLLERLLLVLLLGALVLNIRSLLRLVHRRVSHELIVLLLRLRFRSAGLRLETREVALDHFDHANDTAVLATHTLVRLVEDLRLLDERSGIRRLRIEVLEHAERLRDGGLCSLRVCNGDRVFLLLFFADAGRLGNSSIELGNGLRQLSDLFRELSNGRLELVDLCVQGLDSLSLLFAGLLVRGKLRVAPPLVLSLLVRFLHELHDEILDHLLDLLEGIF